MSGLYGVSIGIGLLFVIYGTISADETTCTVAGNFPYVDDSHCKTYYTCVSYWDIYFAKVNYTCPFLNIFNPTTKICTMEAVCINSICSGQLLPGFISDPNALNKASPATYIFCKGLYNPRPQLKTCPTPQYFDVAQGKCVAATTIGE